MNKSKFAKKDQHGLPVDSLDNYVRVGADYFRIITKPDRYGVDRVELKQWKKDEIKTDFGKDSFANIPKYADFTIVPDNTDYHPVYQGCYNMYKPFNHKPAPGDCPWSKILMQHIFGEQYDLGVRYLKMLYMHPRRIAPILVLVSKERQTGKTTFINWLNMIFGANMVIVSPEDLQGQFNSSYATSNIIAVEEAFIEKDVTVEKLKYLATGKFITVNIKYVNNFKLPFYGKVILASNNEDKFARVDDDEIRFFIRKVGLPEHKNHNIEDNLLEEIPAFLQYLIDSPEVDFTRDRSGFTPDELKNEALDNVKNESKSWLFKSMSMKIEDLFLNELKDKDEFLADPIAIKEKMFLTEHSVTLAFIRSCLKNEFKLKPSEKAEYFTAFDSQAPKVGRPYVFKRECFTKETVINEFNNLTENEIPF